jgi:hypothetical protein
MIIPKSQRYQGYSITPLEIIKQQQQEQEQEHEQEQQPSSIYHLSVSPYHHICD